MRNLAVVTVLTLSAWTAGHLSAQTKTAQEERARAWAVLRARLPEARYQRHSAAVEAIMRELAVPGTDDVEHWGLAGLLHDIDISETASDLTRHGVVGAGILRELGFPEPVVHAVNAHDDRPGVPRTSRLDHAVYCADQVYWLVSATGFSFPSERLNSAQPEAIWEMAQAVPSKKPVLGRISDECAKIGRTMPQTFGAVQSASRKLLSTRQ
ncbi:MAG: HDIG domain-containing protein [Paludibaculum sp.]